MRKKLLIIFIPCFVIFFSFLTPTFAQDATTELNQVTNLSPQQKVHLIGITQIFGTKEKDIQDGSIISYANKGAHLSEIAYDRDVFGVISRNVAITLFTGIPQKGIPVIVEGPVEVLVSTKNGAIKKGDPIATSTIPGVGVKALKSGQILGVALEDYDNPDSLQVKAISAKVELQYFTSESTYFDPFGEIIQRIISRTQETPFTKVDYLIAAGVIFALFFVGFLTFGTTTNKVLRTLDKNSLAARRVHQIMIFNVLFIFIVFVLGLFFLSVMLLRI